MPKIYALYAQNLCGMIHMSLRVTQTPRLVHRAAHSSSYAASPIAAPIQPSRLDNFVEGERIEHAANAHEASRTILRSWHTQRLPQRHAPREQCSASAKEFAHGVSQRRRLLCALRWVAPRLLRRGISTALRVGAARVSSATHRFLARSH